MDYPAIKPAMGGSRLSQTQIILGGLQWGIGVELTDGPDGTLWQLLKLMDGSRTRAQIVSTLTSEHPGLNSQSVLEAIDSLIGEGFVEDAAAPLPPELDADELERYERSRHYFARIERRPRPSPWDIQCRLKRSRVCVLGLGGVGSAVAASLVATGVGTLTCVDHDTVSVSNLNRSLLYSEEDVGRSKVDVAVRKLGRLNHHVEVRGIDRWLGCSADFDELLVGQDLVVLCADKPPIVIAQWMNRAALRTGTPWQLCLYSGPMAVTGIFLPGQTACWGCIPGSDGEFPDVADVQLLGNYEPHAVIAPSANLTGQTGALTATYFLAGLPVQAVGRVLHHSLTRLDHAYFVEPMSEPCGICGREVDPPEQELCVTSGSARGGER